MATLRETFSDIADAIRAKGATGTMTPLEMSNKIENLPTGGGDPRYEVNQQGGLVKKSFEVDWFDDVTSIPNNGLYNAYYGSNVTSASFPNVTSIGTSGLGYAFYGCSYLTSVDLSKVTSVGNYGMSYAFYDCSSLTSVDLSSLASSEVNGMSNAFRDCSSLTSADLSNLASLGNYGLASAFYGCSYLTSVDLSGLTSVGNYGLSNAFNGCTSLTSADLSSLTSIPDYGLYFAFSGCSSLTSVDLSNVASAGTSGLYEAFAGCSSLKNVYLSSLSSTATTTTTGSSFTGCTSLELVDFSEATAIPAIDTTTFNNTNTTFKIVVPDDLYPNWRNATNWSSKSSQIEMVHPGVSFKALEANSTIRLVAVGTPDAISLEYRIGDANWTTYTIGDTITLTNVDDIVYFRNTSTSFTNLGKSETDYHQFQMTGLIEGGNSISFLNIKNGITPTLSNIRTYCFYKLFSGCTSLAKAPSLYFGISTQNNSNAHYAFAYMFEGCTNLEEMPEGFNKQNTVVRSNYLYKGMFKGCTSLTSAELPQ